MVREVSDKKGPELTETFGQVCLKMVCPSFTPVSLKVKKYLRNYTWCPNRGVTVSSCHPQCEGTLKASLLGQPIPFCLHQGRPRCRGPFCTRYSWVRVVLLARMK